MIDTALNASPAERRYLPRRIRSTFFYPSLLDPIVSKIVYTQSTLFERRDLFDRRKDAQASKHTAHWPHRASWIVGMISLGAVGIGYLLYPTLKQQTDLTPPSYATLHTQYEWVGFHRLPPTMKL